MPTTLETPVPVPGTNAPHARRVAWASLVGTTLESFDFYVFAYFSAIFSPQLFFPGTDRLASTLAAFSLIAVSFVVRPIGAIIFGTIGDRLGRRPTLILTVTIMGVSTGLIGALPAYAAIGAGAPILLTLLRVIQGLSLGGEWGGSILIATERVDERRRGLYASIPQLGSPVGTILTAALYLILPAIIPASAMLSWGWRLPFLVALPLLAVSLYLRLRIDETPTFRALVERGRRERFPVLAMFRRRPVAFVVAIGAALLGIGSYSLMNTYTISYGVTALHFDYTQLLIATTIGSLLQLVTIPLFGAWANRIGSARVVAIGAAGTLLIAFPMYFLLQFATFPVLVATMIIGGILPTLSWAALGGLMADLFGGPIRYSALSIAYAVAATISGFVPLITTALAIATNDAWWHPGIVVAMLSAITLVAAIAAAGIRRPADELSD